MKIQYNYELISDYLHGLLDSKTASKMHELIKTDEIARNIALGIVQLDKKFENEEAVEVYLNQFQQSQLALVRKHIKASYSTRTSMLRIAAVIVLLVTIGFVVRLMVFTPDLQSLANQELKEPYPIPTLSRSEGGISILKKGYQFYSERKFDEAAEQFDLAFTADNQQVSAVFYGALSHLYVGNYGQARQLLESSIIEGSRFDQQARWYLALSLIKQNDRDYAVEVLDTISRNQAHFKSVEASKLLKELK